MRKFLVILVLLLATGGLLFAACKIQTSVESPPPYREAVRESRLLLPLLERRKGAVVEAEISLRATRQGESPLARALFQGMHLRIRGAVAPRYSDLSFFLGSGSGLARWQEIEVAGKRVLVVEGTPYRMQSSFLDNNWPEALRQEPLLRLWKKGLPSQARPLSSESDFWAYRTPRPLRLRVPLLQVLGAGKTDLLFSRSSGAPGGVRYLTETDQTAKLLGVSPSLLVGSVRWQVSYRVLRWGAPRPPALPERLYPQGGAALQTALLPFYRGLSQ